MPENEKFIEGVKKSRIEQRIEAYNNILNSETIDKTSFEYTYAQDVIEEIKNLLMKSNPEYTFLPISEIENRIEMYLKKLEYLDKEYLVNKKEELQGNIGELGETSSSSDEKKDLSTEELLEELDRLLEIEVSTPTVEEIEQWKSAKTKKETTAELNKIEQALADLENRDAEDVKIEKRVIKNRIDELESINREKELFKIDEKGEVTINYPDIVIDEEAVMLSARAEYQSRKQDMLDKFYGNRAKSKEYADKYYELYEHMVEKDFEFVDANGQKQTGVYCTIENYETMEQDLAFLQLEEIVERLERLTKAEAGDLSVYDDVHVRDKDGKIVKLSPEEARKADEKYVDTNNGAYNKLVSTRDNLKTLGKYGEKVPYTQFQKGQPVRNIVRAVGNAAKFVRNHVTAPINKFVGSKIISPIYGVIVNSDENVSGLYSNKRSHRYVARREYYESLGQGYLKSRFNSVFRAKEGNKAILSAGAYDIQQSLIRKYTELAEQDVDRKKKEFAAKSVEEKYAMIKADLEQTTDETAKARLQATLNDLEKAKAQIAKDKELNEKTATAQTIQTDAIDISQHDVANKENVTRTITGIKLLSRLGIKKLVGPKIEDWLAEHVAAPKEVVVPATQEELEAALDVQDQRWVPTTYKTEEVPVFETRFKENTSMSEIMSSNAGKQIEGYYSVYSGESGPAMYNLTGNEKITAIFQSEGIGGTGLSDTAGLKAPTFTDGTFAKEFLDANGVLKQDTSLEQVLEAVGNGEINPDELSSVYVSVGDRYWAKLSDLCQNVTEEVQIGTKMKSVPDVLGHYETLTEAEKAVAVAEALKEAQATDPDFLTKLSHVETQLVENTRVTNVLRSLGRMANKGLLVDDVYENVRKTNTEVDWEKPYDRHYEHETKFKGSKREDVKKASKKNERDER